MGYNLRRGIAAMQHLIELVDLGIALAERSSRADLRRRLEQTKERLLDPSIRVIMVGEFKQGKSQLVNGLVNAPVCPVDDDIATAVPTSVRHGDMPAAFVLTQRSSDGTVESGAPVERREVAPTELADYVSERAAPESDRQVTGAEVFLPRKLLRGGLTLIDSPGVGGLTSAHALTTLATLPSAHAMLFVSDASQEYTEPEIQFLRHAMRITPNVACVLTKTDMYPQWRRVEDLDRAHLRAIDPDIPLFPVSSHLRLTAVETSDPELNAESGFPALVSYLRRDIVGQAELLQRRSTASDLLSTSEHVRLAIDAELGALESPEKTPEIVAQLEATKGRADELRRLSSRWQTTLNDGVTDLIADMEHDLRDRMRSIQREAEDSIDEGDPGPVWDQFVEWFERRVSSAVTDTFVWTQERATWLSEKVARHFTEDEVALPVINVDDTRDVLDAVGEVAELDSGRLGLGQKFYIGLKGSYGGVLMVGIITGIIGMSIINPLSLAAGAVIGRKAYKDDTEARLQRRRNEAKVLIRRQVDEIIFQVGKQLRDRLRLVQRTTRDHFTTIADEHHRSLADSVLAAQKAASLYAAERDKRVTALRRDLARVDALTKRAAAIDIDGSARPSSASPEDPRTVSAVGAARAKAGTAPA
ncbi:isoniazid-induced dynamin-like GTPase IniA [Agromyces bauzanensis]|uniref:Isoniazid-inducible protein iniA n=2 Tax=Agromyces bauzanensis TaxID=1308924 RepID=A0A917URA7_9MICO|nr:isoniazid-inducible protein iniA [Agromyces bauzanensis]